MAIGLAGIIWFVLRQFHTEKMFKAGKSSRPALLDLSVLRNRSFSIGTIIASLSFFAFSSLIVLIPLFIQDCRGYSATISGLVMLPGAIAQAISQFFGGRALDRFGARPVALIGTILLTAGTACMSTIGLHTWIWYLVLPVHSPDRHGLRHDAGDHMVIELPQTLRSLRWLGSHEHGASDRRRSRLPGDDSHHVFNHCGQHVQRTADHSRQHHRHRMGTAHQRRHQLHHDSHGRLRRQGEDAGSAREAVRIALHHDSIEQEDKGTKALAHTDDTAKLRTIETGK